MRTLVSNNQSKLLESFKLNDVYHYNSVLFNFENEQSPMSIIESIFNVFIEEALNSGKRYDLGFSESLTYSYFGMYFTIEYNHVKYEINLHTKKPRAKENHSNGLIDYYFTVENILFSGDRNRETVYSWDQVFKVITGYSGVLTCFPLLSPYSLVTLVSPLPNSINNQRPTFLNIKSLNDETTKVSFEMITINGVKKIIMEFNYDDDFNLIPTGIIIHYDGLKEEKPTAQDTLLFLNELVLKE